MKLKPNIHENGIDYTLSGDCYLPELRLPEDNRPIGRWGRLHREYLKTYRPLLYQSLLLSGKLYTRGGMLESFLICPGELTDDQVMELLKLSFRQQEVVLALAKMIHDLQEARGDPTLL